MTDSQFSIVALTTSVSDAWTWRLPGKRLTLEDRIRDIRQLVRTLERGRLDGILYADFVSGSSDAERWRSTPPFDFDPLVLAAVAAQETEALGIVPTISTTWDEPYRVARQILSLDHFSGGRIAWNAVTSISTSAPGVFGAAGLPTHAERYARADEFIGVVKSLWQSFPADSRVDDRAAGIFNDVARVRTTRFQGEHLAVDAILGQEASVQGRPVIVQAGSSSDGIRLGAKYADAVFVGKDRIQEAAEVRRQLREQAEAFGRPYAPRALSSFYFLLGSTEEEAARIEDEVDELTPIEDRIAVFTKYFGADAPKIDLDDLDAPIPPFPETTEIQQTALAYYRRVAAERPWTVREFLRETRGRYFFRFVGTPERAADTLIEWFRAGAADGFVLNPKADPFIQLAAFAEQVVPILQGRGVFRREYSGSTFREHLGIAELD